MLSCDEGGRRPPVMKEADALPRRSTWMNMAPRVTTDSQGMSRREAMGWRAPLPFWALRAAKLCRVKRFLERAELSEVELVTTSSAGREGGVGGGRRWAVTPGSPPGPTLAMDLPGATEVAYDTPAAGTHTAPGAPGSPQHPSLPFSGGLALWAHPSTHLCPSRGARRSRLSPAPTFALLGGPGTPGSP